MIYLYQLIRVYETPSERFILFCSKLNTFFFLNDPHLNGRKCSESQGGHWKGNLLHFHCVPGLQVWKSIVFNNLPPSRHSVKFLPHRSLFALDPKGIPDQITSVSIPALFLYTRACCPLCFLVLGAFYLKTAWRAPAAIDRQLAGNSAHFKEMSSVALLHWACTYTDCLSRPS